MRGSFAALLGLAIVLLVPTARAQPGQPVPPVPPASAATAEAEPPPRLEPLTPKDRILFNAGLDALVIGDFNQARSVFVLLAQQGETLEARTAATVIVDRIGGLEHRRAAGLLPPLRVSPAVEAGVPGGATPPPSAARPRPRLTSETSARAPVVATTSLLGLALWGWTLPVMLGLDSDNARSFVGLYMLTATSAFVAPYVWTINRPPTPAQANLLFYGGTRGAEWGLLLSNLVFGRKGGDQEGNERAFATSMLLGSLAGTVGGAYLAKPLGVSPGDVRTMAVLGDYGLLTGFAIGRFFGFHELGETLPPDRSLGFFGEGLVSPADQDKRARATAAAGLVGTGLGLVGGRWLASRRQNTWGDGEVMRGTGLLGVLAAAAVASALDFEDEDKLVPAVLALGGGVGLVAGDFLVRTTDFTPSEALMTDLALVAGGLGGAGLTYLFTDTENASAYLSTATVGAATAGGLVAWALSRRGSGENAARASVPRMALLPRLDARGPSGLQLVGSF